ncbi:hypothetical protein ACET3Z_006533 [Daucus carota]
MWMAFEQKDGSGDDCVAKEKDGDKNSAETVDNILTSIPFAVLGYKAPSIFQLASTADATVNAEVSLWRTLWNHLFSQVSRAVQSILNDFVAFFTACNRNQLRHKVNYFICLKEREIKILAHTKSDSRPLPDYAPTTGYNLVFTDQYQFLMLSHGSLDELNSQLEELLPVNHFRPRYPY